MSQDSHPCIQEIPSHQRKTPPYVHRPTTNDKMKAPHPARTHLQRNATLTPRNSFFPFKVGGGGHECDSLIKDPVTDAEVLVHRTPHFLILDPVRLESAPSTPNRKGVSEDTEDRMIV
jgi:hypothetical protein